HCLYLLCFPTRRSSDLLTDSVSDWVSSSTVSCSTSSILSSDIVVSSLRLSALIGTGRVHGLLLGLVILSTGHSRHRVAHTPLVARHLMLRTEPTTFTPPPLTELARRRVKATSPALHHRQLLHRVPIRLMRGLQRFPRRQAHDLHSRVLVGAKDRHHGLLKAVDVCRWHRRRHSDWSLQRGLHIVTQHEIGRAHV